MDVGPVAEVEEEEEMGGAGELVQVYTHMDSLLVGC